jgi:hypothetical protein
MLTLALPYTQVRPVVKQKQYPATFRSAASSPDPFSLPGLLKACEHNGYAEAEQPPGMTLQMFPFQRQTLQVRERTNGDSCVPCSSRLLYVLNS